MGRCRRGSAAACDCRRVRRLEFPDAIVGLEVAADLAKGDALVGDDVGAEHVPDARRVPAEIDLVFDQFASSCPRRVRESGTACRCGTYFRASAQRVIISKTTAGGASMSMAARTVPRRAFGSRLARITISSFWSRGGFRRRQFEIGRLGAGGDGQPQTQGPQRSIAWPIPCSKQFHTSDEWRHRTKRFDRGNHCVNRYRPASESVHCPLSVIGLSSDA